MTYHSLWASSIDIQPARYSQLGGNKIEIERNTPHTPHIDRQSTLPPNPGFKNQEKTNVYRWVEIQDIHADAF